MKRLTVLGVTGSVGRRTLELVEQFPDEFRLEGMAARGSAFSATARTFGRCRPASSGEQPTGSPAVLPPAAAVPVAG